MRYFYIFLCVLFLIFSVYGPLFAVTLEMSATDKSKLPEGPAPSNYPTDSQGTAYAASMAQTFSFAITGLQPNQYYRISAKLTRSNYDGFAANFPADGTNKYKDLAFLRSDYVQKVNGKTTYPLGWRYKSDTELSFNNEKLNYALPGGIIVRCYDWGANGTLTVRIERKTGNKKWVDVTMNPLTHRIPFDANGNQIADGWESDTTKNWVASADDENVPNGTPAGDGWSVYGEYRGLFLNPTDSAITRLNPTAKDVLVCSSAEIASFGTGSVGIPHHSWGTVHEDMVNDAWATVRKNRTQVEPRLNKSIGEVSFNSEGIPGYTDDRRAWAIRIDFSSSNPERFGDVPIGSPSYTSKILVYKTAIRGYVIDTFADHGVKYQDSNKKDTQEFTDAVKVVINNTISHEIGHALAIEHCTHAGCVMRDGRNHVYTFDSNTKVLTHDITGIDADHDAQYAARGVIGLNVSNCGTCGDVHTDDEDEDGEDENDDTTTTPTPAPSTPGSSTHPCGIHATSVSGDHSQITPPCGDPSHATIVLYACQTGSTHATQITGYSGTFYECQPHTTFACGHTDLMSNSYTHRSETCPLDGYGQACSSGSYYACQSHTHDYPTPITGPCGHIYGTHERSSHARQASCTQTNANGDSCTVTGFYACQTHTHVFPVRATCANGHTYDPSNSTENNRHRTRTCRWCSQTWEKCTSGAPTCLVKTSRRCWAIE